MRSPGGDGVAEGEGVAEGRKVSSGRGPGSGGPGGVPDSEVEVRDPGLQPERTRLAWRRTTLAFTVAAVLAGRQVVSTDHGGLDVMGTIAVGLGVLLWVGFIWAAHRRIGVLGSSAHPPSLPARMALVAAGCTVLLAAFALPMVL